MRKILRRIAHARMAKAGLRRVNKADGINQGLNISPVRGGSYFAYHWRDWAR